MTTSPVTSITDEQIAEIERLADNAKIVRSGNPWFTDDDCCWWTGNADEGDFMSAASPETLIALITRLRAAEEDARRLEWMMREQCIVESQNGCMSPIVYRLYWRQLGECQAEWYPTEREAIDAAMERQP